jgi:hypothetical protein
MTLPSGQISLVDLNNSLNGGASGPIYLTSFYANGSTKSRGITGIPLSGAIGLQSFQSKRPIPVVSGLVGKYTGESWNAGTGVLVDETGSGNDTNSNRGGTISVATGTTGLKYIYGGITAGLRFPTAILPATYTLFYLSRYNGASRGRIMNGASSNWLSTHHAGSARRCYHEGYLYDDSFVNTNVLAWCIGSDQNSLYRSNGRTFGTSGGSASSQLSISYGYYQESESSDWAVYSVIVYNRTLTLQEILLMEQYLRDQYQTLIMSVNDWYSLFTRVNSNATMIQGGSDPDVQIQMNWQTIQSSNTSLWYNKPIQNYTSFVADFEIYIGNGTYDIADGSSFNIGHTGQSFWGEGPNAPAFSIAFHVYPTTKPIGIYIYNNSGTQVAAYANSSLSNFAWTSVRIIYTRSTTNTWQIFYNNTNVLNYSNPNNESWVTSSAGTNFGFGSRTGGGTHDFAVRRFNLSIQD